MFKRLRRRLFRWVALFTLRFVRFGLKRYGYQRFVTILVRLSPRPGERLDVSRCKVNAQLIDHLAALRMTPQGTCLHRSLTLWWLLRFQGLDTQVRTGARRNEEGEWDLHAWVEHAGIVVNDDAEKVRTYTLMPNSLAPQQIAAGRGR